MSTWAAGQFIIGQQGQNGASVSAWLTSRFTGGTPIAANTALPSGTADAGPVTTGVGYGGAGFYALELPDADDYAIAIQWDGSIYYFLVTAGGGGGGALPSWFQYGEGSPVGTVVPSQQGAVYQDTLNGAFYEAIGNTDADWISVGGNGDNTVPGVTVTPDGQLVFLGALSAGVAFSDLAAIVGSGNGFFWNPGAADGDQTASWQTGAPSSPNVGGIDVDGNMTLAGWVTVQGLRAFHIADADPNTAEPGNEGDVCWRADTRAWYGCSTTGTPGTWTELSGGAGQPDVGTSQYLPASLEAVKWLALDASATWLGALPSTYLPSFTEAEPTLTATANGALSVDGSVVSVADRVLVLGNAPSDGVYVVTQVGSVSTPFILTRAGDASSSDDLGQDLLIRVTDGSSWANCVAQWIPLAYGSAYVVGTNNPDFNIGVTSAGTGPSDVVGSQSIAFGFEAHAEGSGTAALTSGAHSEGNQSLAYLAPGAHSESGGRIAALGDSQFQRAVAAVQTTDATPAALAGSPFFFTDSVHTCLLTIRVVARRTDVPGTDSAWTLQGVIRGDGSSTYSWVGGTAPVPVLVAQDVAASTWAVAAAISGEGFAITVTGQAAKTINWSATIEMDEVAG